MHTVSLFPHLLDYQMLGTFLLRVTLGLIFVSFWYEKVINKKGWVIHFFEKLGLRPTNTFSLLAPYLLGVTGGLLVVGLYTQAAAIASGLLMTLATLIKWHKPSSLPDNLAFYILLAIASFALLFLGAGAFAIDLPL